MSEVENLKIIPLGGLGEIGQNCTVFKHGKDLLVLDCGLMFSDLEHFGVEFSVPDFSFLSDSIAAGDTLHGILITHGHEDHIGALTFAFKYGVRAPVYATRFTGLMIREKFAELGISDMLELHEIQPGDAIELGPFVARPVQMHHSIPASVGYILDTPVGRVVHTGDFNLDEKPYFNNQTDLAALEQAGNEGVLLLMSDSTNVEVSRPPKSEAGVYARFRDYLKNPKGLTLISMFSSNVSRVALVLDIAREYGMQVALSGRSVEQNIRLAEEAGLVKNTASVLIPLDAVNDYPREKTVVILTGSQAEYRSALIRIARGEHANIKIGMRDKVILSSKIIPGNEKAIGRMINQLFKLGADVLYEPMYDVHVTGHATRHELKRLLEVVKPKYFLPVHGEYRHLIHHARLGREVGIPETSIVVATNGEIIELAPHAFFVSDSMEESRILIEGRDGSDVSKLVLKDRRQLGETGIVMTYVVRDSDTGRVIGEPQLSAKGLASEAQMEDLIKDSFAIIKRVINQYEQTLGRNGPPFDLQENIRVELRRYYNLQIGRKPVVLPMVLDL